MEEEALTPTGQYYTWSSGAGQPNRNTNRNSSKRALVGTAEGFRRPVRAARDISGAFPQMVNAPRNPTVCTAMPPSPAHDDWTVIEISLLLQLQ